MQFSEVVEVVQALIHLLDMTEEDINEMVNSADTDIDTAFDNALLFYNIPQIVKEVVKL